MRQPLAVRRNLSRYSTTARGATFGDGVGDFLLSAYAPSDALMRATQLFTAFSMLCGYPLYFDALRRAVCRGVLARGAI